MVTPAVPRVAVLDDYQGVALTIADWSALDGRAEITVFDEHLGDEDAVVEALRGFDVLVAMRERTRFPRSVIERLPNLKLLVTTGMRNAAIDLEAARDHGVMVCGTELGSPYDAAELTWALLLAAAKRVDIEITNFREGRSEWSASDGWAARSRSTAARWAWTSSRGARTSPTSAAPRSACGTRSPSTGCSASRTSSASTWSSAGDRAARSDGASSP